MLNSGNYTEKKQNHQRELWSALLQHCDRGKNMFFFNYQSLDTWPLFLKRTLISSQQRWSASRKIFPKMLSYFPFTHIKLKDH